MQKLFTLLLITTAILLLIAINSSAKAASILVTVSDQNGNKVTNAVVMATPVNNQITFPKKTAIMDQVNKEYVPKVIVITPGTAVSFPNKDNIKHHVYSFSKAMQFELPLYEGMPAEPIIFNQAGEVVLGCNIHDWMKGYIYVSDTPFVGLSSKTGTVNITSLADDTYKISVWHPQLKGVFKILKIELKGSEEKQLELDIELKPERKIRRNRGSRSRRY